MFKKDCKDSASSMLLYNAYKNHKFTKEQFLTLNPTAEEKIMFNVVTGKYNFTKDEIDLSEASLFGVCKFNEIALLSGLDQFTPSELGSREWTPYLICFFNRFSNIKIKQDEFLSLKPSRKHIETFIEVTPNCTLT